MSFVRNKIASSDSSIRPEWLDKVFAVFLGLYPFLCIYKLVNGLTIGDAILILFFLRYIGRSFGRDGRTISVIVFIAFVSLSFVKCIYCNPEIINDELASMTIRWVRVSFYLFAAILLGRNVSCLGLLAKTVVMFSALSTLFLVFQYVAFYGAGTVVLGRIPGLEIYIDNYSEIDYEKVYSYAFRPCSFFLEPASFVQYAIVAQSILLFSGYYEKRSRIVLSVLLTFGAIMTTSAQGILYFALVYAVWLFRNLKSNITFVFIVVAIAVSIPVLYSSVDSFQYAVDRLFTSEDASDARLGSYALILELDSIGDLFLGQGFGYVPSGEWFSGAVYVLHGIGLLGFLLVCCMFYQFFRHSDSMLSKIICVVFFVMLFGTALFYNYMVFWYFLLIVAFSEGSSSTVQNAAETTRPLKIKSGRGAML